MALLLNAGDTVSRSYSYTQPSPLHPSQPSETGDMSDNILTVYKENYSINASGMETYNNVAMIYKAEVAVTGSTFTLNFGGLLAGDTVRIHSYTGNTWQEQVNAINIEQVPYSFTVGSNIDNIRISIRKIATDVTMTEGQYKIPILSGNTTTPVYLGEVQTTRKVKKLVLTGEELWKLWNGNYYSSVIDRKAAIDTIVCSHFINSSGGITYSHLSTAGLKIAAAVVPFVTSVSELKAWLAAQYAAGTPVTVWYVLAEPKTGIVNEPLMKIGDYADEVSGISIPTTAGANTLSVDTTLQPSEVSVNYKGWHPITNVHEHNNGAWN